ncbi:MAG: hypothetical protein JOY59_03615, partial [Candidatus Eremiobacteraeota bacterium]|nr:hypothetical protein [Candidatus Eremiobacteraeota bacterium]
MNLRLLGASAALIGLLTGAVVSDLRPAQPQAVSPPSYTVTRGERGSARNLVAVRRRLERLIDQMQHDQRDYGGYRVKAIADLQQARADIVSAIQYD